jgi:hypothetical protein
MNMAEQSTATARAAIGVGRVGTVSINVVEGVKLDTLHSALDNIARLTGCLACGLVGIDVIFRGGDPELAGLRNLPGVTDVTFAR